MSFGDTYLLLVRRTEARAVSEFLRDAGSQSYEPSPGAAQFLPAGWDAIRDVRIDVRPSIAPPRAIAALIPASAGPRLRLLAGLPLSAAHHLYLRGGAPAVALSTLSTEERFTIKELESGETIALSVTENLEFPLWQLPLEPGSYEVEHGESKVVFQIVDGIAEVAGPGFGDVVQRGDTDSEVRGTIRTPTYRVRPPTTVVAPARGTSVVLLGPVPGDREFLSLPLWMCERAGYLAWRHTDAWAPFEIAWMLRPTAKGKFLATALTPLEPREIEERSGPILAWAGFIRDARLADGQAPEIVALWDRYSKLAKDI